MDALVIVNRIREAEALAGSGRHGAAMELLNGLLGQAQLADSQRQLVQRKVELISRQQQRATRMWSARQAQANVPPLGIDTEVVPSIPDAPGGQGRTHRIPPLSGFTPEPGPRTPADAAEDGYFGPREQARSGLELEQMARNLPPSDPSRELALEVLRLRGEVERLGSGRIADRSAHDTGPRDTAKATARARNPQRTPTPVATQAPQETPTPEQPQTRSNVVRLIGLACAIAAGMALAGWVAHLLYSIFNA
jgi:hypothetical protein